MMTVAELNARTGRIFRERRWYHNVLITLPGSLTGVIVARVLMEREPRLLLLAVATALIGCLVVWYLNSRTRYRLIAARLLREEAERRAGLDERADR